MYRELIGELIAGHSWARLQEPCPESEIERAQTYIGYAFPDALKALLRETDGDHWFLLSAQEMIDQVKRNREIMAEYFEPEEFLEKVDRHLFFASNGCGDYYCYRVAEDGSVNTDMIYIWEHELFETHPVAQTIPELIRRYYNNEI